MPSDISATRAFWQIIVISTLRELANQLSKFPIYHISLGDLINELFNLEDQLKNILSQSRTVDLEKNGAKTSSPKSEALL
jgi:hypothetical protein